MELDHIAVAGACLEEAAAHVEEALGVALQPGGEHQRFGTHNRLLGLADGLYLEAIAIDPCAPDPDRPRWFDLDRFDGPARLTNWICRVEDIGRAVGDMPDAGQPVDLERGALRWQMAVPSTGQLPFDNLFPALIEWQGDLHPATMLTETGCSLTRLVVAHPEAAELRRTLGGTLIGDRVVFEDGEAGLEAEFQTPSGRRVLR